MGERHSDVCPTQRNARKISDMEMKIQDVLSKTTQFFRDKKIESARLDAELLIAKALELRRIDLYLKFDQPMKENEVSLCRDFVRRRAAGEPVAYILKEKGFYGLNFFVDARVLIPRPESEMLVELGLDILNRRRAKSRKINRSASAEAAVAEKESKESTLIHDGDRGENPDADFAELEKSEGVEPHVVTAAQDLKIAGSTDIGDFQILDLGCGSGCLALAVLSQRSDAQATMVDRSEEALQVAKINAENLGLASRSRCLPGRVQDVLLANDSQDLILANPPYIRKGDPRLENNVEKFEPSLALFGGESGLDEIEQWLPRAAAWLKPGGTLLMEIGADQGEAVMREFKKNNFINCELKKDLAELDRVVIGQKPMQKSTQSFPQKSDG